MSIPSTAAVAGLSDVLILKFDEHNPRVASTDGHPFVETPNFDRRAASGVVYESAYAPSPLFCPSRSSFISGRPVHEIQCYTNLLAVPRPNYPSYGSLLAASGVHTAHVGNVDAYRPPGELGITEIMGQVFRGNRGDPHFARDPLALRADAVEPHFPHHVTEEFWDRYAGHDDLPEFGVDAPPAAHAYAAVLRQNFGTAAFTESPTRTHRRTYYGRVGYVGAQRCRLLDKLDVTGLRNLAHVATTRVRELTEMVHDEFCDPELEPGRAVHPPAARGPPRRLRAGGLFVASQWFLVRGISLTGLT